MRLYFDSGVPVWLVVLVIAVLGAGVIRLYARHRLPKPYRYWLPFLRITVIGLLVLTFLQPVVVRVWRVTERGHVALLIDNSGSMSIRDDYSLPEQVEIGWELDMFPRRLRCTAFREPSADVRRLENQTAAAGQAVGKWRRADKQKRGGDDARAGLAQSLSQCRETAEDLQERLAAAIAEYDYLKPGSRPSRNIEKNVPKPERGRTGGGGLILKRWHRLDGWEVARLTESPRFKEAADDAELITQFSAPRNVGDNYGGVIQGYIHPPVSGEYVFLFCSDDQGQLYLSPTDERNDRALIAECPAFSEFGNFNKYPNQRSKPIELEQGRIYYIEAVFKENAGEDHCVVAWQRPDDNLENPIPADHLSPYGTIPRRRVGPAFDKVAGDSRKALTALIDAVKKAEAQTAVLAKMQAGGAKRAQLQTLAKDIAGLSRLAARVVRSYNQLQTSADVELAASRLPEVNVALDRFVAMRRNEIIQQILLHKPVRLLRKLEGRGEVDIFSLDEKLRVIRPTSLTDLRWDLPRTSLGTRLGEIFRYYEDQPVAAVVILSDGNNNAGKALREARELAAQRDVPLYTIGIGAERPPRDVAIDHVVSPLTSFKNDMVNVSVVLKRDGFVDRPITLKIVSGGKTIHHKVIPPGSESRITVDMSFVEKRSGILNYRAQAESFIDEELKQNNRKAFRVNVLRDPIKTLLVDEFPRWESRYCNMMLQRDQRIDIDTIFIGSLPGGVLTAGDNGWPPSRDALFAYQILIIGDVNPRHFSQEQLSDMHDFVVERGGVIVFMAGPNYMPDKYAATPLVDLFPVRISRRTGGEDAGIVQHTAQLASESLYDPLVQIGSTPESSARLWEELPALNWVKGGVSASRAADRLVDTRQGDQPVMLKTNVGLGKVLYLGSDSFWRWRYRARWTYHHRFWGQILLWATLGRETGADRFVKLTTSRPEYTPGETVEIRARLLDENELPIKNAEPRAEVFSRETGHIVKLVTLEYLPDSGGKYVGFLRDLPRGKYRIIPVVDRLKDRKITAEAQFAVRDLPTSEYVDLALDVGTLKSLSPVYRPYDRAGEVPDLIASNDLERLRREEREVWDSFWVILFAAFVLGVEWHMRKRCQLV